MAALETKLEQLHLDYFRLTSGTERQELKDIATKIVYSAEVRGIIPHDHSEKLATSIYNWDTMKRIDLIA